MVLMAAPDFAEASPVWPSSITLPMAPVGMNIPIEGLEFLGWISPDSKLPLELPFSADSNTIEVQMLQSTAVVALFRSTPDVFDHDSLEIPNQWWGHLFRDVQASIQLNSRAVLAYPDALEYARAVRSCLQGNPVPEKGWFLSDTAWNLACDEAAYHRETCRNLHKG